MTKKLNRLPNSDGYCSCVEESAAGCSVLFKLRGFYGANGSGVIAGAQMIFDCKKPSKRAVKNDRHGLNDIVAKTSIF